MTTETKLSQIASEITALATELRKLANTMEHEHMRRNYGDNDMEGYYEEAVRAYNDVRSAAHSLAFEAELVERAARAGEKK